jgi:shikimate kinase / 3-dehydroquinate synthase
MIVLVGFMGAGKTTVGRLVAQRLGGDFMDTDEMIEQRTGATVAEIFAASGEDAFRALERDVVAEVLSGDATVVALGGGALGDSTTRVAIAHCTVVHLGVGADEALRRLGADSTRPLLADDPRALHARRHPVYQEVAGLTVKTDAKSPEEVAAEVEAAVAAPEPGPRLRRITVEIPARPYDIVIGVGLLADVAEFIPVIDNVEKALIVTQSVLEERAAVVRSSLEARGLQVSVATVGDGEQVKSLATAAELYDSLARLGAHRDDLIVSMGGGVVSDLAGFVAATYNRGMAVVHLPTTLLGQVDAAIGGKTGVNLTHGKNLVGAFHQPVGVVCDVTLLETLPDAEFVSGLAEVAKYGFIAEPSILDDLEKWAGDLSPTATGSLIEIVGACAEVKARIVAADERDKGLRAHLNYGHTFAHAIERAAGYSGIRHGEAVSLGMMCAGYVANEMGWIDDEVVERHHRVLDGLGLPTSASLDLDELEPAWRLDKKYRKGIRFVLLQGIGRPRAGAEVPHAALVKALERMA